MSTIIEDLIIVDDEQEILESLKKRIKRNIGSEPSTTMNPDVVSDILAEGRVLKVLAFDFDLQYVSNKSGLQYLVEFGNQYSAQLEEKVLFSKGIIDLEKKNFCAKLGIKVYEKNLKELPGQLLRLMHKTSEIEKTELSDTIGEIISYKRTSEEIWFDMKLRFKNELLRSLRTIENKNSRFNVNMSQSITIEKLIKEIEDETPLGLEKIESWAKAQFRINDNRKT